MAADRRINEAKHARLEGSQVIYYDLFHFHVSLSFIQCDSPVHGLAQAAAQIHRSR